MKDKQSFWHIPSQVVNKLRLIYGCKQSHHKLAMQTAHGIAVHACSFDQSSLGKFRLHWMQC